MNAKSTVNSNNFINKSCYKGLTREIKNGIVWSIRKLMAGFLFESVMNALNRQVKCVFLLQINIKKKGEVYGEKERYC